MRFDVDGLMLGQLSIQIVLGVIFLEAGIGKLGKGRELRNTINHFTFELLPPLVTEVTAFALPIWELALAVLLWKLPVQASIAMIGMLVAFSIATGISLSRGRLFECNCFGAKSTIGFGTILRNVSIIALCAVLLRVWQINSLSRIEYYSLNTVCYLLAVLMAIALYAMLLALSASSVLFSRAVRGRTQK